MQLVLAVHEFGRKWVDGFTVKTVLVAVGLEKSAGNSVKRGLSDWFLITL